MNADIRSYLEIRTASPSGFNHDGTRLLISSNVPGTAQVYRLDLDAAANAPLSIHELTQLSAEDEPIGAGYLPTDNTLLVTRDTGGNERHQLYLTPDEPLVPLGDGQLRDLVVDPEHIHRPGGLTRDGRLMAYSSNRRTGDDFDVYVRNLEDGSEELVYSPGGWTGAGGFSPHGTFLNLWELTERPGDNRSFILDRGTGTITEIDPHDDSEPASVGSPSWLPDESAFFYTTDVGRDNPVICRATIAGGAVDSEMVLDLGWPAGCAVDWTGAHLVVSWNDDGRSRARLYDPHTLQITGDIPIPGDGVITSMQFSKAGDCLALGYSSSTVPGDTWLVDTDALSTQRLTVSPNEVDDDTFVAPELVHFTSFDDLRVPAFVYRPNGTGRHPVVVMIHGGPESQYRPSFAGLTQYLVASGFAVVAPNVRGSTGYGKRYQHLDDVGKRLDSVADLAALHGWICGREDLDPDRAALYGASYGGYMVLAGLALQPQLWAAGVDIVGMSSLVTFLENTSSWRRKFREREYGSLATDREVLVAASPITYIESLRAPLFIVHGANDPRVPLSEAQQIHAELTSRNIRCELAVYHDEGHGLAKLANRLDAYPRVVDFLGEVLA